MPTVFKVQQISTGYKCVIPIRYGAPIVAEYPMLTGRILVHFKTLATDEVPLFVLDSDIEPASIVRSAILNEIQIELNISAAKSALIKSNRVFFDIAHYQNGEPKAVPGRWEWPVLHRVTRP